VRSVLYSVMYPDPPISKARPAVLLAVHILATLVRSEQSKCRRVRENAEMGRWRTLHCVTWSRAHYPAASVMSGEAVEIGRQEKRGAEGVPSPARAGALQKTSSNLTTAQPGNQWGRKRGTQATKLVRSPQGVVHEVQITQDIPFCAAICAASFRLFVVYPRRDPFAG
jgi:hypothetical protein